MSGAGSQGEGGPGEMELSVADATAAFEMVLSPGAGRASAARGQAPLPPAGYHSGRDSQCRLGSAPGDARGKTPLPTTPLSKTPPVFHTVWKRLWTFPRLFHSLWKTMLKSTVCKAVCNPPQTANPGIAAEKHAPRSPVDMHKKPDGQIPQANRKPHRMSTNAGGQNPRLSHRKQKKSVHNDRFVAVGTPPDTPKSPKNHPRTRISTIRQGKIRIFRTEPRRQKRQKVPAVAGYSGFPQFPAPYCSCFWMEG